MEDALSITQCHSFLFILPLLSCTQRCKIGCGLWAESLEELEGKNQIPIDTLMLIVVYLKQQPSSWNLINTHIHKHKNVL